MLASAKRDLGSLERVVGKPEGARKVVGGAKWEDR